MVLIVFSHFSLSLHSDPVIFLICSLAHFLSYNFRLATLPQSACSTQIFGNGYSTRGWWEFAAPIPRPVFSVQAWGVDLESRMVHPTNRIVDQSPRYASLVAYGSTAQSAEARGYHRRNWCRRHKADGERKCYSWCVAGKLGGVLTWFLLLDVLISLVDTNWNSCEQFGKSCFKTSGHGNSHFNRKLALAPWTPGFVIMVSLSLTNFEMLI